MRGPFLLNQSSPSTTMKKHILTLTALIALAGCSSATAPKALQSAPAAPVAKATSSLPNVHDAAAHDRMMMTTIRNNILSRFPGHWDAKNGPTVQDAFYADPARYGPGFCVPDNSLDGGCDSAFNGQSVGMSEIDDTKRHGHIVPAFGDAFGLVWSGLSVGQCSELLAGGVASTGAQAVTTQFFTGADPETAAEVSSWCQGASKNGSIDNLILYFTPNEPYEFLNAPEHSSARKRRHSGS
jgi:hypothetical protein